MFRLAFGLAVLLPMVAALAPPAPAQSRRAHSQQTLERQVAPGGTVRVFTYGSWNADCEPRPAPQIVVRDAPAHGTVTTRPGSTRVGTVREGAVDCYGREMPGTVLLYTAAPGFRGIDRFDYDVLFETSSPRHDTAIVDVH